jgi:hypothetical protein
MWTTASKVLAHFMGLPENTLVTRRDLLHYGTQNAVDTAIIKLRRKGVIVRMAWGVYVRPHPGEPLPLAREVAAARIRAFHRKQTLSSVDEALVHGLREVGECAMVFEVDASTSSFRIFDSSDLGDCVVYLRAKVARKMLLDLTPSVRAIKALWSLGESQCVPSLIARAVREFNSTDRAEFKKSHRLMPGWLSDSVHKMRNGPKLFLAD